MPPAPCLGCPALRVLGTVGFFLIGVSDWFCPCLTGDRCFPGVEAGGCIRIVFSGVHTLHSRGAVGLGTSSALLLASSSSESACAKALVHLLFESTTTRVTCSGSKKMGCSPVICRTQAWLVLPPKDPPFLHHEENTQHCCHLALQLVFNLLVTLQQRLHVIGMCLGISYFP